MSTMHKAIVVPSGVEVTLTPGRIEVKGPLGELALGIPRGFEVKWEKSERAILVGCTVATRQARSMHGLLWANINNMVRGVTEGFKKEMEVHGTGYQVRLKGDELVLLVGFCHDVVMKMPTGLTVEIRTPQAQPDNPARFVISGADKAVLGQFAADVRAVRPPEPYKGKGIRYATEHVRRKEGKAFAGAA